MVLHLAAQDNAPKHSTRIRSKIWNHLGRTEKQSSKRPKTKQELKHGCIVVLAEHHVILSKLQKDCNDILTMTIFIKGYVHLVTLNKI